MHLCIHWYKVEDDQVERILYIYFLFHMEYIYIGQIAKRRTSHVFVLTCKTRPIIRHFTLTGRVFGRVLHVESKHITCAYLCYLSHKDIFQYVFYKIVYVEDKYALLHHSRINTRYTFVSEVHV